MSGLPNGRARRGKGQRGEREVAAVFAARGFPNCARTPNSGGLHIPGDLAGVTGYHIEVKRQETIEVGKWWRQAEAEAEPGTAPVVCFRRNGDPWRAIITLDTLANLMQAASVSLVRS